MGFWTFVDRAGNRCILDAGGSTGRVGSYTRASERTFSRRGAQLVSWICLPAWSVVRLANEHYRDTHCGTESVTNGR